MVAVVALLILAISLAVNWIRAGGSQEDAAALSQHIRALRGVESIEGGVEEGDGLPFMASSSFSVTMAPDATEDDLLEVVSTAYEAFSGTFRRDSANIGVDLGAAHVELHTNGPDATQHDVLDVVTYGLNLVDHGEMVTVDINARDDLDDLVSEIRLQLPEGTTAKDVTHRLESDDVQAGLPANTDVHVVASDGAGVGGSRGLPRKEDLEVWRDLSAVRLPGVEGITVRVEYGPFEIYSTMQDFGFANVTVTSPDRQLTDRQVAMLADLHQRILERHHKKYVYNLTDDGDDRVWLRRKGTR